MDTLQVCFGTMKSSTAGLIVGLLAYIASGGNGYVAWGLGLLAFFLDGLWPNQ